MKFTDLLNLPYPELDDDFIPGSQDIKALALAVEALADQIRYEPGDYIFSAASTRRGALLCNGQRIVGGVALYPNLAARCPQLQSGADLVLPDFRNRMPVGSSATRPVNSAGGAETVQLTWLQSGVNGYGSTGGEDRDHQHLFPGATTGADSPDHAHSVLNLGWWTGALQTGGSFSNNWMRSSLATNSGTTGASARHAHTVPAVWVGGRNTTHLHPLTARNADQAHENMPPWLALNVFIKV